MLNVEDLSFRYKGGVEALDGIRLAAGRGEVLCILGHNGAGKSTLMRCLNGLLRPTSGVVLLEGQDTAKMRPAQIAKRIGLCFQNPDAQLFCNSVVDEIRFGAENARVAGTPPDAAVEDALNLLDLQAVRDKNPYELSLSVRKRVAVASVVAMNTPMLILDEPTGNLDRHGVELIVDLIGELTRRGVAVLLVTHDIDLANDHADHVVVLRGGRVHCSGSPRSVFVDDRLSEAGIVAPTTYRLSRALGVVPPERNDVAGWFHNRTATKGSHR